MKSLTPILFISLYSTILIADVWHVVSTNTAGTVISCSTEASSESHTLVENEYPENYLFPTNDFIYWKKVGSDWVGMSTNEQNTVKDSIADKKASFENWRTEEVKGDTLADAFTALVICINKRLPATNRITASEFKQELKLQLKQSL